MDADEAKIDSAAIAAADGGSAENVGMHKTFLTATDGQGPSGRVSPKEGETAEGFPDYEDPLAGQDEHQDTQMLKQQQKLRVVDDALEYMKREYKARMEEVSRKEGRLRKDKSKLEELVERFRDFISDNDAKRNRGLAKAAQEKAELAKLQQQEELLRTNLEQLQSDKAKEEAQLSRLRRYQEFLQWASESSGGDFKEPDEIVARFAVLQRNRDGESKVATEGQQEASTLREQIAALRSDFESRQMQMSSQLQAHASKLEQLQQEASRAMRVAASSQQQAQHVLVESGLAATSVTNLYRRIMDTDSRHIQHLVVPPPNAKKSSSSSGGGGGGGRGGGKGIRGRSGRAGEPSSAAASYSQPYASGENGMTQAEMASVDRHADYLIACLESVRRRVLDLREVADRWKRDEAAYKRYKREEKQNDIKMAGLKRGVRTGGRGGRLGGAAHDGASPHGSSRLAASGQSQLSSPGASGTAGSHIRHGRRAGMNSSRASDSTDGGRSRGGIDEDEAGRRSRGRAGDEAGGGLRRMGSRSRIGSSLSGGGGSVSTSSLGLGQSAAGRARRAMQYQARRDAPNEFRVFIGAGGGRGGGGLDSSSSRRGGSGAVGASNDGAGGGASSLRSGRMGSTLGGFGASGALGSGF